jgi:hypothetical protein
MMTTEPRKLIHITITDEDVRSIAEEAGIPDDVALARASAWSASIEDTASALINEQLVSVIESDQP